MKVYKVVEVTSELNMFSTGFMVKPINYSIGVKSTPVIKNSKLFCFSALENAVKFLHQISSWSQIILECEGENVAPQQPFISHSYLSYEDMWAMDEDGRASNGVSYVQIYDSMGADAITPLRIVGADELPHKTHVSIISNYKKALQTIGVIYKY